jgi:hypothetical protein
MVARRRNDFVSPAWLTLMDFEFINIEFRTLHADAGKR